MEVKQREAIRELEGQAKLAREDDRRQIEERSRNRRHWDPMVRGSLGAGESAGPMHRDSRSCATTAGSDGHLDPGGRRFAQSP